ncbi:hypothetical protein [Niallia taxi]|uniref:hypothetical protein n=1 Tax=Niallia taxi TaxID=2499688 RepID=UPI0015F63253|nr:hypothetical protein [Niallia taxi]
MMINSIQAVTVDPQLLAKEYVVNEIMAKGVDDFCSNADYRIRCVGSEFTFWQEFLKFGLEASNICCYEDCEFGEGAREQVRLNLDYITFVQLQSQLLKVKPGITTVFDIQISKLDVCVYYRYMRAFAEILSDEQETLSCLLSKQAEEIFMSFSNMVNAREPEILFIQEEYISYLMEHDIAI